MTSVLPINNIKSSFIQAIENNQTVILSAPPGAGKSTCLPLWLLDIAEFSGQKIYLLQPRRVAVKNIALYLASELGESVGQTIGYRLRNETKVSQQTQLEVITEGILTQIMQNDAELSDCGLVIFDEFHERSLHGDLAFALARDIQQGLRDDLKLLLMSATLDSDYILKKLPDAVSLKSLGRSFPIEIHYDVPRDNLRWREHLLAVIKNQIQEQVPDQTPFKKSSRDSILVFLPGIADIHFLTENLVKLLPSDVELHQLYGELTLKAQQQVIAPSQNGNRKIVLSTNIAETSLTIEGINCVLDCGFEKRAIYDNASLTNKLVQQKISKASAIQRAGRAGRLMAGKCIRLYAKDDFERRPEQSISEIQQADLLPSFIEVARWGVTQLTDLPFLELPSEAKQQQTWQELANLNIVDKKRKLTTLGDKITKLSCHPRFAKMILVSKLSTLFPQQNYASLACLLAATLEERDLFRSDQARFNSDIRQRLQLLVRKPQQYQNIILQAQRLAKQATITFKSVINSLPINETGLLLILAYPERIAKMRMGNNINNMVEYLSANGKGIALDSQDPLSNEHFIVAAQVTQHNTFIVGKNTGKSGNPISSKSFAKIQLAAPIAQTQLEQFFSDQITTVETLIYNETNGKINARKHTKFGALVLTEVNGSNKLTTENIATMWTNILSNKGLSFLNWRADDIALKTRLLWLNNFVNTAHFPDVSDNTLLATLSSWFTPFVGEIKNKIQLNKLKLSEMLLSLLDYNQQQNFKKLAPNFFIGPTGRRCPITYNTEQQAPKVSLPMQEVYGFALTPQVGDVQTGRGIPLVLELLSPAGRPIQVTQDLAQFWQGSYFEVQKEMKAKYPKHYWPDDPTNAKPTNKTKRHIL
ncbi:MAG: ATP-dependent helicase HrpB [Gammaproteobacteria bacterium]|nr:MAG: ATP-dependent helicase HrpB [Gammaproteobacteria bacterium]